MGGFHLVEADREWMYKQLGGKFPEELDDIERTDPRLIALVESGDASDEDLHVIEIPDDVDWIIENYDGNEWIAEKHRTWHE